MGLLGQLLTGRLLASWAVDDDRWYQPAPGGQMTPAGLRVDEEQAQKLSAWYRGRDLLATCLAMLPLVTYKRLPDDGGSEPVPDHPLYDVLHGQPNGGQDSFQWRRDKMFHLIDHGWSYDWIVEGARGFAHELQPIHPRLVTPEQIKSGPNRGRYLFHIKDEQTARTTVHTQDEIFYLRGAGGKGILEYARTSLGTALATEGYAAGVFGKGTMNGGIIQTPGVLNDEASKRMAQSFITAAGDWHLPKVLEQGATFTQNIMSPEDAQMLLSRKHGVDDVARWLGVPRQMLENSDPSFGNAEQFDQSFITYSLGGWLSLFEFAINSQLILFPKFFYVEFTRDAIARGKLMDRWNVHVAAVNAGIKTVDECRAKEGLNKRGGKADELREPQNITGKPTAGGPPAADDDEEPTDEARAQAIARYASERILRAEVSAVQKAAVKHADDADAFAIAVTEFYATNHAAFVSRNLVLSLSKAREYCAGQASQVLGGEWMEALALWQTPDYAAGLAAMALEEAA